MACLTAGIIGFLIGFGVCAVFLMIYSVTQYPHK